MKLFKTEHVSACYFNKGRRLFCILVCSIAFAGSVDCFDGNDLSQYMRRDEIVQWNLILPGLACEIFEKYTFF